MYVWVDSKGRAFGFSSAAHPDTEVNSVEVHPDIAAVLEADPTKVSKLETSPDGLVWSKPPKVLPRGYVKVLREARVADFTIILDRMALVVTGERELGETRLAVCEGDSIFELLYLIPLSSGKATFVNTEMVAALTDPKNLLILQGVDPRSVVSFTQSHAVS